MTPAQSQLNDFVAKFTPPVAAQATACLTRMRQRLPGALVLVYDNYNALALAFSPTERASDAVCSLAVFPRWVSLFLVGGPTLDDPHQLLRGTGTTTRHIVLAGPETLDDSRVQALLAQAIARSKLPLPGEGGRIVIKSISAKQRPRR